MAILPCTLYEELKEINGTTPMEMRSDALVRAAGIIAMIDKIAREASKKYNNHSVGIDISFHLILYHIYYGI